MNRYLIGPLAVLTAAIILLPGLPRAAAQAPAAKSADIPRTADGKPDFSGIWQDPPGRFNAKDLPYKPGGEKLFIQPANGDVAHDDPHALCIPTGWPHNLFWPGPQRILQPPGYVTIFYEYDHWFRIIPTDGRPHGDSGGIAGDEEQPTFFGDAVGRWEGDTLVVETIGLKAGLLDHGLPLHWHSDKMKLIEHMHLLDPLRMSYEVTIDDPVIFTMPWSQTFILKKNPTGKMYEFVCEDNNRCPGGHCSPNPTPSTSAK
jgi:hypothetical protein